MSVTITAASAALETSVWLVEVNPTASTVGDLRPPPMGLGSGAPLGSISTYGSATATAPTVAFSDRGWIKEPADTHTIVSYPPRMLEPPAIERSFPVYPTETRRANVDAGELVLTNADGGLDSFAGDWSLAGREVKVFRADYKRPTQAYRSTWTQVASLRATEALEGTTSLKMPLDSAVVDLSETANRLYAGTGGTEGSTDIANVAVPRVFGLKRNVSPVLVNSSYLIFQVNDGATHEIFAVRDGGQALTNSGDVASYSTLTSTIVSTGTYKTNLSGGFFKVATTPTYGITADVRGNTDGGYASTSAQVAAQILRVLGGVPTMTASSFAAWPSYECGICLRSGTVEDALNQLAMGLGYAWWGADALGAFSGSVVRLPESFTSTTVIQPYMLTEPPEETSASMPPWWRVRVAYQDLETVQQGGDLATGVSAADKEYYGKQRRYAVASDYSIRETYPTAIDGPEIPGVLESAADAQTLADTLLTLYRIPRRTWSIKLGPNAGGVRWWTIPLGSAVTLYWPQISSLASGKVFVVRGVSARGDYAELELWG